MASLFAFVLVATALAPAPASAKLVFSSALRGGVLRAGDVPDEHAVDTSGPRHVGEDHEHGGRPGGGGVPMVPRTHVHNEKQEGHGDFHWSYSEPDHWGDGYGSCGGEAQSPIDLATADLTLGTKEARVSLGHSVQYKPLAGRNMSNRGHNVQVNGEFGMLKLPDGPYEVKQFHFHFPSEHTVDGQHAAGEIQIVHQQVGASGTNSLAVIAILLQEPETIGNFEATREARDKEIGFLASLGFDGSLPREGADVPVAGEVDLNVFAGELSGDFFHYYGSLTTPPCSQTVHWYVLEQPAAVTPEMVQTFKALYPSPTNNRPVKPLNGRALVFSEFAVHGEFEKANVVEAEQAVENAEEAVDATHDKMKESKQAKKIAKAHAINQQAEAELAKADVEHAKGEEVLAVSDGDEDAAKEAAEDVEAAEDEVEGGEDELAKTKTAHAEAKEAFEDAVSAHDEAQDEQDASEDVLDDAQAEQAGVVDDAEDGEGAEDTQDAADSDSQGGAGDGSVAMHASPFEEGEGGEMPAPSRQVTRIGRGLAQEAQEAASQEGSSRLAAYAEHALAAEELSSRDAQASGRQPSAWTGARRLGFSPMATDGGAEQRGLGGYDGFGMSEGDVTRTGVEEELSAEAEKMGLTDDDSA